eukprot:209573_1
MGPLSYIIAIACVAIAVYFWYTNSKSSSQVKDSSRIEPSKRRKTWHRTIPILSNIETTVGQDLMWHNVRMSLDMRPKHVWQLFSTQVSIDYPLQSCQRQKMSDFLGGNGCLEPMYMNTRRATLQTVVLADKLYGVRKAPRSMTNLKNWITHELCCLALSQTIKSLCPGIGQEFNAKCMYGKRSDIFLPDLCTHIEIKTDVWSGKCKNQHSKFRSKSHAVYCIKFRYRTCKALITCRGHVNDSVLSWVTMMVNTCVLPVFLRWSEYIIHHSSLVKKKREQNVKSDKVYTMKIWPSVDHGTRFKYID